MPLPQRFTDKFTISPDGCWIWHGATQANGYGVYYAPDERKRGPMQMAHRYAYEQTFGRIPGPARDTPLDHFVCERRNCVNPEHVRPVSHWENYLRANGRTALNKAKTHCLRGHPFEGDNVQWAKNGTRHCRQCSRERIRERRAQMKVKV